MADAPNFTEERAQLAPNEFRLLLKFRPSAGEAARVFKFYEQWLLATSKIVNEFVSHVHKGMHISIRLVEIKEGSADPKFLLDPMLITTDGQKQIPQELFNALMPKVQEIISGSQDYLVGSVGDENYNLFYQQKLREAQQLAIEFHPQLKDIFDEPQTARISAKSLESLVEAEPSPKDSQPISFKKGKVFRALTQMADATSENLLPNEKVIQRAAEGEEVEISAELMRESSVHKDEIRTTRTKHKEQEIVAVRAVLHGNGAWSFLWNGRVKSMEIKDPDWNVRFKSGAVSLVADQRLKVDIQEENVISSKMGVEYKRKNRFTIIKVY